MTGVRKTLAALSAAFAALPAGAADRERIAFEGVSPWTVDYANDSCALRRMFRHGDRWVQLNIRRFSPSTGFTMSVATNALRQSTLFQYRFNSAGSWRAAGAVRPQFTRTFMRMTFGIDAEFDSSPVSEIDLTNSAFGRELALQTGSLNEAKAALEKCLDDLLAGWGVDPQANKTLSRRAAPINSSLPLNALSGGGLLFVRWIVDERGVVAGCAMNRPLNDASVAEKSQPCPAALNALSFTPALDQSGRPLRSYWALQSSLPRGG